MAEIKSSIIIKDFELTGENGTREFAFAKFSASVYHPKRMVWDSKNADGSQTIPIVLQNIIDSKLVTVQKPTDDALDKYLKRAHSKKLSGDKQGGIDLFQVRFVIDGTAQSVKLKNPTVEFVKNIREDKKNFFVFTVKTSETVVPGTV